MSTAVSKRRSWLPEDGLSCFFIALVVAIAFLFVSISRSGIWDPYELERVELARRIAIHLFGAEDLVVAGAVNSMPTLTDLGAGELAFTSMALGLSQLGLHDWAGRLPLALWGLAGAMALFGFLARLVSPRAGLYGVVALCTMPLYFMQARTMLGDIVTMAAFTFCFCGFAGALLDKGTGARAAWLWLGLLGVAAGYLSRGVIIGVAAPLLAVGLGWLVLACGPLRREVLPTPNHPPAKGVFDPLAHLGAWLGAPGPRQLTFVVGSLALLGGLVALYLGVNTLLTHAWDRRQLVRMLGVAMVRNAPVEATFDLTIRDLGHALFPWSALLPFAIGRLFQVRAQVDLAAAAGEQEAASTQLRTLGLRVCLLVGAACGYAAHALVAPYAGGLPFVAPALLAAIIAIVIHDFERGAPASGVFGVGTAVLAFVLLRDMLKIPVKSLSAFSVPERNFPSGFEATSATIMKVATLVFCGLVLLSWLDPGDEDGELGPVAALRKWAARRYLAYREALTALQELWKGNLVFGFLVVEAALVGLGAMLLVGRHYGWANVVRLPHRLALLGLNLWWVIPLAIALTPVLLDVARGSFALLMGAVRLPRSFGTTVGALACGALLCFGFYPALAAQLSPKKVFQSYSRLRREGEPLGLLGLKKRVARYYANGGAVVGLSSTHAAFGWLTNKDPRKGGPRRWLALRRKDLAELNAMWRGALGGNLPVLDARSGQILLASNKAGTGDNHNPLGKYLPDTKQPPPVQHPVSARFDDKLEVLGWEVRDESGRLVEKVTASTPYRMRFFYRVLKPISRNYKAFIHIDGEQRRHNGDHEVLDRAYPVTLWRPGDIIADPYDLTLEPNFTSGKYVVHFGFFMGKQRFAVSHGRHHKNRVNGGVLLVR